MFTNTKCLIKACIELNINYDLIEKSNFLTIKIKSKPFYFINNAVPINSHIDAIISQDKDFTYKVLKDSIRLPKTSSYMDPNCQDKYREYLSYYSQLEILDNIIQKFKLPLIIKRNKGSIGNNVFLCKNSDEISDSINTIFNQKSKDYDYLLLAQEYIPIFKEFRVIVLNKRVELVYEKNNSNATFLGNLSPLHFIGAKTIKQTDSELLNKIQEFINLIFEKINIPYFGADIAIDKEKNLWLIEINSKPGFEHYVKDNGEKDIIELYKKLLKCI